MPTTCGVETENLSGWGQAGLGYMIVSIPLRDTDLSRATTFPDFDRIAYS